MESKPVAVVWDGDNPIHESVIQLPIDDNIIAALPPQTEILKASPHGHSYWTRTAKLETRQVDGSLKVFFLKVTENNIGKEMLAGELYSMNLIHSTLPSFSPQPLKIGTFKSSPDLHFYLCEFVDLTGTVPSNVTSFGCNLALLHILSSSHSQKYGAAIPVYGGNVKHKTTWTSTWEEYFTNWMRDLFSQELKAQGPDEEIEYLSEIILKKVIPRLLRPMEIAGRTIRPVLCHGDLWDGNVSQEVETGRVVVYDACAFYGHHEVDLGPMRLPRHKLAFQPAKRTHDAKRTVDTDLLKKLPGPGPQGKEMNYIDTYLSYYPPSEPKDDCPDRILLYMLRFDVMCSAAYPGMAWARKLIRETMRELAAKYSDGFEGWAEDLGKHSKYTHLPS